MKKYLLSMFILCLFVWAVVVDNANIPSDKQLRQDVGTYSRYRVKKWETGRKFDIIEDELMIYAIVKNREQLYYMDHRSYLENSLRNLPSGTPMQLRYVRRLPKFWKRQVYEIREGGIPIIRYPAALMDEKQKEIWKFSGIMTGIFLFLAAVGWFGQPRRK